MSLVADASYNIATDARSQLARLPHTAEHHDCAVGTFDETLLESMDALSPPTMYLERTALRKCSSRLLSVAWMVRYRAGAFGGNVFPEATPDSCGAKTLRTSVLSARIACSASLVIGHPDVQRYTSVSICTAAHRSERAVPDRISPPLVVAHALDAFDACC